MTLFLSVGQGGNQLASTFWQAADSQYLQSEKRVWADRHPFYGTEVVEGAKPRQVCHNVWVDSEPKVIHSILRRPAAARAAKDSVVATSVVSASERDTFTDAGGRGNLWAWGYYGTRVTLADSAMDAVRRKLESVDRFQAIWMNHSVAGGTGSGLGSKLMELLRDAYPRAYLVSNAICPFTSGETALQSYNAMMCLTTMQDVTDMIVTWNNDELLAAALRQRRDAEASSVSSSLLDMNQLAAFNMAQLLFPDETAIAPRADGAKRVHFIPTDLAAVIADTCLLPTHKFATMHGVPHTCTGAPASVSWRDMCRALCSAMGQYDDSRTRTRYWAWTLTARGVTRADPFDCTDDLKALLAKAMPPTDGAWNAPGATRQLRGSARSLGVLVNSSRASSLLNSLSSAVEAKLQVNAYVHWFERHGCDAAQLHDALEQLRSMGDAYGMS